MHILKLTHHIRISAAIMLMQLHRKIFAQICFWCKLLQSLYNIETGVCFTRVPPLCSGCESE